MRSDSYTQDTRLIVGGLHKTYANGVKALDNVSLDITQGLYGLLGPNGAGKSTLMRTLATLQRPDRGSIHLGGIDALENPEQLRQQLGYLPQRIGAYPAASARSLLSRFAILKGWTDKRERDFEVARLLEQVNLVDAGARAVDTFSGGMLQRFGIAVALIGTPQLIIVDEPTAGLDPAERNRFHSILADAAQHSIILLSTHIVEDIENLCRSMSIVVGGKIIADGQIDTLKSKLNNRLWRKVQHSQVLQDECALHSKPCPNGHIVTAVADSQPEGYQAAEPNLEDVYHHMTANTEDEFR